MKLFPNEIRIELAHQHRMLHIQQQKRRLLELQQAQYDIDVPLRIISQLACIAEQIATHYITIEQLEHMSMSESGEVSKAD